MDQSEPTHSSLRLVTSALLCFVLNCIRMFNSLYFFVFCISLSLSFPLALSLRMSFLFYGSLSEGYIPALCRLMPTRTSKIINNNNNNKNSTACRISAPTRMWSWNFAVTDIHAEMSEAPVCAQSSNIGSPELSQMSEDNTVELSDMMYRCNVQQKLVYSQLRL